MHLADNGRLANLHCRNSSSICALIDVFVRGAGIWDFSLQKKLGYVLSPTVTTSAKELNIGVNPEGSRSRPPDFGVGGCGSRVGSP